MTQINLGSELLNYIIEQGLHPGDRLPTLSELQASEHLGISVSKVREQLEVARALGLVEVRSKTGTRLKDYSFTPAVRLSLFFALATDLHFFELFSALRNHIEVAFWHEACALLTDEDKTVMRKCIDDARQKLNNRWIQIPYGEHRIFHLTVFKRLENPFVLGLLEAYWDAYETVEINRYADYEYMCSVWNYHERILEAICANDFDAAQQAFVEHTKLLRYQPDSQNSEKIGP